jgi:hypothetical protein
MTIGKRAAPAPINRRHLRASAALEAAARTKPLTEKEQIFKRLNSSSVDLGPVHPAIPELGNIRRRVKMAVSDFDDRSTQPPNISGSQN